MGDEVASLTVEILKQIRDEGRKTNERLEILAGEVRGLREETGQRLERVEGGLNDLGKFMRQIALDQSKHERFDAHHVEKLEGDVRDLQDRVSRLESSGGPGTRTQ